MTPWQYQYFDWFKGKIMKVWIEALTSMFAVSGRMNFVGLSIILGATFMKYKCIIGVYMKELIVACLKVRGMSHLNGILTSADASLFF